MTPTRAPVHAKGRAFPAATTVANDILSALLATEYKRLLPRLEHVRLKRGVVTPDKAIVQLAGGAFRMKSKDLREEVRFGSPLQRLLIDYTRTFLAVLGQSVACSQHHSVDQRLARWLLTMSDYAGSREIQMVQQSIAAVLGVRRASITVAAHTLQAESLIAYRRGRIGVLNKPALQKKACECYRFIRDQYRTLHAQLPRLLSPK